MYTEDEFTHILHDYGGIVKRLAYIHMKNNVDADDIYQEVFIKLVKKQEKIIDEEHLKNWLIRATLSSCRDIWKSAYYRHNKETIDNSDREEWIYKEYYDGNLNDEAGLVTEAVMSLPQKYREVIHLYYYEGYSEKEIADILNVSAKTISTRILRGRKKLRDYMEKEGINYDI